MRGLLGLGERKLRGLGRSVHSGARGTAAGETFGGRGPRLDDAELAVGILREEPHPGQLGLAQPVAVVGEVAGEELADGPAQRCCRCVCGGGVRYSRWTRGFG